MEEGTSSKPSTYWTLLNEPKYCFTFCSTHSMGVHTLVCTQHCTGMTILDESCAPEDGLGTVMNLTAGANVAAQPQTGSQTQRSIN